MKTAVGLVEPEAESCEHGTRIKPFLKWAGGKSQLLPELLAGLPQSFNTYYEPFMGAAALFFALEPSTLGCTPRQAVLSDICSELVNCFCVVRDDLPALIAQLSRHRHDESYYYQLRNVDRTPAFAAWSNVERASRFIYLNKTCYNGLYRVNSRGEFNVPFGRYQDPTIFVPGLLERCSQALQAAELKTASFEAVLDSARAGDLVYFDPPYDPLSLSSSFTAYSSQGFAQKMQLALAGVCAELDRKGVMFMLSNSYTTLILSLYRQFNVRTVKAARAINSKAAARGKISEVLVTNF